MADGRQCIITRAHDKSSAELVDIMVNPSAPGKAIPSDFLGLSYESPTIAKGDFAPDNMALLHMVENLGSGVLRFGGNTGEGTYWSRTGKRFTGVSPPAVAVVSPADLDQLFAFAAAAHWKVILGLKPGALRPRNGGGRGGICYRGIRQERRPDTGLRRSGTSRAIYQVKNPNFNIMERPANYTYEDYIKEYNGYKSAIREKVPDAPLAGPGGYGILATRL